MGIPADMQEFIQDILTDTNGFAVPVLFITPLGITPIISVSCPALAIKHHMQFGQVGQIISSKTCRVTVVEKALSAFGFPVRDGDNACALKGCLVSFIDSTGNTYNGIINQVMPDESTGNTVCQVGDNII